MLATKKKFTYTNQIFLGDEESLFLAPRGISVAGNRLIVADTGRNRVFIWHTYPEAEHQEPDVVLGQADRAGTGRNQGTGASASSLQYPSGIWSDGERLIVADAWNHRVLIWHQFPKTNGQPADVVLGQKNFTDNQPNLGHISGSPTAASMHWPYGVTSDGNHLWVADTGNRRILFYESIPTTSFQEADRVIAQKDFGTKDYNKEAIIWPYAVKIHTNGRMIVADTACYRMLLWNHWEDAFTQPAAAILGQKDMEACGQNQFGLYPAAHTLNWVYDGLITDQGIFVADAGNSRILWYEQWPTANSPAADGLIGQEHFGQGGENRYGLHGTPDTLYWPFAMDIDPIQGALVVADTGNHRINKYVLNFES
ncbi:MAG: hypothetical protein AAGI38_12585 [Bacteroidota bacterium]